MIVHRFMSQREYEKLMTGMTLYNRTNHNRKFKRKTISQGFCFFKEDPDEAIRWLRGTVDLDWCVSFNVEDDRLTHSWGMYADTGADLTMPLDLHITEDIKRVRKEEYCTYKYGIDEPGYTLLHVTDKYRGMGPSKENTEKLIKQALKSGRRYI